MKATCEYIGLKHRNSGEDGSGKGNDGGSGEADNANATDKILVVESLMGDSEHSGEAVKEIAKRKKREVEETPGKDPKVKQLKITRMACAQRCDTVEVIEVADEGMVTRGAGKPLKRGEKRRAYRSGVSDGETNMAPGAALSDRLLLEFRARQSKNARTSLQLDTG